MTGSTGVLGLRYRASWRHWILSITFRSSLTLFFHYIFKFVLLVVGDYLVAQEGVYYLNFCLKARALPSLNPSQQITGYWRGREKIYRASGEMNVGR